MRTTMQFPDYLDAKDGNGRWSKGRAVLALQHVIKLLEFRVRMIAGGNNLLLSNAVPTSGMFSDEMVVWVVGLQIVLGFDRFESDAEGNNADGNFGPASQLRFREHFGFSVGEFFDLSGAPEEEYYARPQGIAA